MTIRSNIYGTALVLGLSALVGCSERRQLTELKPTQEIRLYTRAAGNSNISAALAFWFEDGYSHFLDETLPTVVPYFSPLYMNGEINDYRFNVDGTASNTYNTFLRFPDDNDFLYVSGIAPANAYEEYGTFEDMKVKAECQDGLTDLLASQNDFTARGRFLNGEFFVKRGSANGDEAARAALLKWNNERQLEFRHLTAAISFLGKRDPKMFMNTAVENVKISIHNGDGEKVRGKDVRQLVVPTKISRFHIGTASDVNIIDAQGNVTQVNKGWSYVASDSDCIAPALTAQSSGAIPMNETPLLATFYANSKGIEYGLGDGKFNPFHPAPLSLSAEDLAKTPTLFVDVEADLYLISDPTERKHMRWENIEISGNAWTLAEGAESTGDKFLPGYAYQVVLTFNYEAISLRAQMVPWEEIGPYYYPIWGETTVTP